MDDLLWLDVTAQAELVRGGEVAPVELVDAAIARIERLDPRLYPVILRLFERVREEPRAGFQSGSQALHSALHWSLFRRIAAQGGKTWHVQRSSW